MLDRFGLFTRLITSIVSFQIAVSDNSAVQLLSPTRVKFSSPCREVILEFTITSLP